jgi:hypothetical protein
MNDDEVVAALRSAGEDRMPIEVADFLDRLLDGGLSQSSMIFYFKRAFATILLRVLIEAGGWRRLSSGGLSTDALNDVLKQWIGPSSQQERDTAATD